MTDVIIPVRGMHCTGCEARLRTALIELKGVAEATPDHRSEQVSVRFDPQRVSEDQIKAEIRTAGFETT